MILATLAFVIYPGLAVGQMPEWKSSAPVPPIVRKALAEQPHWRFTGTRVVTVKRGAELSNHIEYVTRDGWRQRIEFPAESRFAGQVIVETDVDRRHYNPKRNEIHVTPPRHEPLFEHIRGSWRGGHSYKMVEEGGDRVAGRPTRLVKIFDNAGNCLQELNIDSKFGVVLARKLFDDVGSPVGSFEYREINYHPTLDASAFQLRHKGAAVTTPEDDLKREAAASSFLPLKFPSSTGLILDSVRVRKIAGQPVLMSQYTGPKSWVMLFQLTEGVDPKTMDQKAPKNIHTVQEQYSGHWFVAVGTLDESVLRDAIKAIRPGP